MRYSVLIVGYNSREYLDACMDSVFASTHPDFEVLFLDNGGGQEGAFVQKAYPRARVYGGNNAGQFAGGVNLLASKALGKFLILLNPDTFVEKDWLEHLDAMPAAAGQLEIRTVDGKIETHGYFLDRLGLIVHARRPGRVFGGRGAAFVIHRVLFLEAGGMDEEMGMYFEETDLCWRLNLMGHRVHSLPGVRVTHFRGGSQCKGKFYLFSRNRVMSMVKNYSALSLVLYLPLHILLCLLRPGSALGVLAAFSKLPYLLRARARVQALRKVPDSYLFKTVMVWSKWLR